MAKRILSPVKLNKIYYWVDFFFRNQQEFWLVEQNHIPSQLDRRRKYTSLRKQLWRCFRSARRKLRATRSHAVVILLN